MPEYNSYISDCGRFRAKFETIGPREHQYEGTKPGPNGPITFKSRIYPSLDRAKVAALTWVEEETHFAEYGRYPSLPGYPLSDAGEDRKAAAGLSGTKAGPRSKKTATQKKATKKTAATKKSAKKSAAQKSAKKRR